MRNLKDKVTFRHGATISNRIALAPMLTHSGKRGGFVSDDTIKYYSARSEVAGLLIAEYHYVSETGGPCSRLGFPEQLGAYSDAHLPGLTKLAQALKKDGNKAILQIHHGGIQAIGRAVSGEDVLGPTSGNFPFLPYPIRELTNDEILEIIADFGRATSRAIKAGFDGVEIHGANHYLIQQFFSETTNQRNDEWGGNLEKRMAFPLAVVKEVKCVIAEEAPKDFIVGYRLSPEEIHGNEIGYTYKESTQLIAQVAKHELDYIHLSLWGGYNSNPTDTDKSYAQLFKEVLDENTKLIIVGGVFTEKQAEDAVENYADIIALGRGTLVEPQFAKKVMEGRGNEIFSEITPENLEYVAWTPGLFEAFSRGDAIGLPPIPNSETIFSLHTGRFDMFKK